MAWYWWLIVPCAVAGGLGLWIAWLDDREDASVNCGQDKFPDNPSLW